MTPIHLATLLIIIAIIAIPSGCLYNNAERQAKDIKWCESVGARWQYHSMTKQINCVPNNKSYYNETN